MRIGLLTDTHDRIPAVAELLRQMQEQGVQLVMHAGDYCSPFSLQPFLDANVPLLGVLGRNDGDPESLRAVTATGAVAAELFESPHSFEVGGHSVLLVHDIAEVQKRSIEQHHFVIHGFSHQTEMKTRGDTLIINPGEACGWLHGAPTGAILDLDTKSVEFIKLTDPEWRF